MLFEGSGAPEPPEEVSLYKTLRRTIGRGLTLPGIPRLIRRLRGSHGVIFMLHRFTEPGVRLRGHEPDELRAGLEFLARHGYRTVSLEALLGWAVGREDGAGPPIAFTLDDGYADQAEIGAPILAEYGVPATLFATTGFLDGRLWQWWDKVELLVTETPRRSAVLPGPFSGPGASLDTPAEREAAAQAAITALKLMPAAERDAIIAELAQRLEVELPETPPDRYRPMSWDQARRCEEMGVRIGPHTVTHPALAQETEERVREEVAASWDRVQAELARPVPLFCFPYGKGWDFGPREIQIVREVGLEGAITADPGYVLRSRRPTPSIDTRYRLPRHSLPGPLHSFARVVTGLSRGTRTTLHDPGDDASSSPSAG